MKKVAVSGYFNPIHVGHIRLLKEAKNLGNYLVVILNNDLQVKLKGSVPFMSIEDRKEIVAPINASESYWKFVPCGKLCLPREPFRSPTGWAGLLVALPHS